MLNTKTALILLNCAMCGMALAQDINTSPYLLGDWQGQRTQLKNDGIDLNLGFSLEAAHNSQGGDKNLTREANQLVLGSTLNLEKLAHWQGATAQITFTNRTGRNLSSDANLGTAQQVQEIYGRGQTWHLTQFWIDQSLLNDTVKLKLGRATVGEDFDSLACDFQNLTFCGSQPGNLIGGTWVNWPTSQWASRLKYTPKNANWYAQVGIYQVNPKYTNDAYAKAHGWQLNNPSGTKGELIPVELGWTPSFEGKQGSYKVGAWYNHSKAEDILLNINHQPLALDHAPALQHQAVYGSYVALRQKLTGDNSKGWTGFLNATLADKQTTAYDKQVALGGQYQGLFNRPQDAVGVAIGATYTNSRYTQSQKYFNQAQPTQAKPIANSYEGVAEVYYNWVPVPSIFVRPNVQYIKQPGGDKQRDNAVVWGLKTGVSF